MEGTFTTRDAAKHIGKSSHWLYINAERLGVPRYRIGGQWVYLETELQEWFLSQKVHTENFLQKQKSKDTAKIRSVKF